MLRRCSATGGGNVGIGTTAPSSSLHIGTGVANGQAQIKLDNADGSAGYISRWIGRLEILSSDAIGFATNNYANTKMLITNSGNVGIGTTAPGQALSVTGNIQASGNLMEKVVTFTPTTIGWYRIVSAVNQSGGTVRLSGLYDNKYTDVEFQYFVMGYNQQGSIQQTKFGQYNGGFVDQVRISDDNSGNSYLDIHISSATA
ncbi:MAG: hypothetical protein RL011_2116, partial [Pseudomonadota bacterium]